MEKQDFQTFKENYSEAPSEKISNDLKDIIFKDLNPSKKIVFLKLLIIQGSIGLMTLAFCPQFSLSLTNNYELFHYFHHNFGEVVCMLICGTIFMGSGALIAAYILSLAEIRVIKQSRILFNLATTGMLISILLIFGATIYINLLVFWIIGAVVSSIILFEINSSIKQLVLLR